MDDARGARAADACTESGARDGGVAAWRRRALLGAGGLPSLIGADAFFFVVLPDETAMQARLEWDGDVETDGQQRGEEQTAELHVPIVRGADTARSRYSVTRRYPTPASVSR